MWQKMVSEAVAGVNSQGFGMVGRAGYDLAGEVANMAQEQVHLTIRDSASDGGATSKAAAATTASAKTAAAAKSTANATRMTVPVAVCQGRHNIVESGQLSPAKEQGWVQDRNLS